MSCKYNVEVHHPIPLVEYTVSCGSTVAKLTPEVEVTVGPQPVPSMEEGQLASNGRSAFLIEDTFNCFSISWGN